jgi:hypothetical protein
MTRLGGLSKVSEPIDRDQVFKLSQRGHIKAPFLAPLADRLNLLENKNNRFYIAS